MTMSFQIFALERERFSRLLSATDSDLAASGARWVVVDGKPGYPCRVSLEDAEVGERALLIPFTHHDVDSPYLSFARSITSDYRERLGDVLSFLEENAEADQSIWVADPEFPLVFYTDMRIIDARYHRFPEDPPDWVFATSASGIANRRPLQLPAGTRAQYDEVAIRVRRSPRGGNRPDPHAHVWFEVTEAESEKMRIYRRR